MKGKYLNIRNHKLLELQFCLILLPLLFLASVTGATIAASGDQTAVDKVSDVEHVVDSGNLIQELRKEDISVLENGNTDYELQQLIEKIRSVEIKPPEKESESSSDSESVIFVEPNDISTNFEISEIVQKEKSSSEPNYIPVAPKTMSLLADMAERPEQVDNPFELGEVLFFSLNLKEAALFYQEAFQRLSPGDSDFASDRAWILLQMGNCLRNGDMPLAADSYRQLVTEYPDSIWTEYAKTQVEVIDWFVTDEPYRIIDEYKEEN